MRVLAVAACASLAAACGSTVAGSRQVSDSGLGGAPGPTGAAAAAPARTASLPGSGSGRPGVAPTGPGAAPVDTATQPLVTAVPTASDVLVGKGVTDKEIRIGVYVAKNGDAAFSSLGLSVSPGDNEKQTSAVLARLNAEGGLRGRRFVPVFQSFDLTSTDRESADRAACETWTLDHPVFAVVSMMQESDVLVDCLAKAGIPYVSDNRTFDQEDYRTLKGLVFQPSDWSTERLVRGYIGSLVAQGFLTRSSRVGWLVVDDARGNRDLEQIIKPEMARQGLTLAAVGKLPAGPSGPNQTSFVLQFEAAGVDRVLTLRASPIFFMQQAESQRYHPLYGIHSGYSPAFLQTSAPAAQLRGARAFAWLPAADTDAANDPGPPTPRARLCRDILVKAGLDTSTRTALLTGLWYCDSLLFIRDALAHAPNLTQQDLGLGTRAMRSSYVSGVTFASAFPVGRQDGAAAYRDLAYVDACSCFRYSGPLRRLPG